MTTETTTAKLDRQVKELQDLIWILKTQHGQSGFNLAKQEKVAEYENEIKELMEEAGHLV